MTWAMDALAGGSGTIRARLLLHAPIQEAAPRITAWQGVLEPVDEYTCRPHTHGDSLWFLAHRITALPLDYTLLDPDYTLLGPPELAGTLTGLAERAARAVRPAGG